MSRAECLAGVLGALALVSARADAAITVTTVLPLVSDICDVCEAPQIRRPITVGGLPSGGKLSVTVQDVSLNNRHDTEYRNALTPAVVEVAGHFELQIGVTRKTLREDGTYIVALEFSVPGEPPVATTLQLVRPSAVLQPPGTLIVERVLTMPWSQPRGVGPPLMLLETSRRTGLTDIQIASPNPLGSEHIDVTVPPVDCPSRPMAADSQPDRQAGNFQVAPGSARCLAYLAQGAFPWGSQMQAYSLTASELAAPVPITFDVRTRLWRVYVVIYILLGGLVGFLVKIRLQQRIDREEARALGFDLQERVAADLAKRRDSTFRAALDDPFKALERAMAATKVEDIAAARSALDTAWRAALADLATRRSTAEQLIDRLRSIAETQWQVPPTLLDAINELRLDAVRSRELLGSDAVTEATMVATTAVVGSRNRVAAALVEWQDGVVDMLEAVVTSSVALPAAVVPVATAAVAEARLLLGSTRLSAVASADDLITALSGASTELRAARKVARVVALALDQETDRVAAIFGRSRDGISEVAAAVEAVKRALFDAIDRPDRGQSLARTSLAALNEAWKSTFEAIGGGSLPKAVSDLLDQRRFGEAATALVDALRGESDEPASAVPRDMRPLVAADDSSTPIRLFSTRTDPADVLAPIRALRARTQGEIARAKLLQTAVVALLACLVGYGLFAPKFVGDYQDFLIIFFWAFGLDLSVDAVARLAPAARR